MKTKIKIRNKITELRIKAQNWEQKLILAIKLQTKSSYRMLIKLCLVLDSRNVYYETTSEIVLSWGPRKLIAGDPPPS